MLANQEGSKCNVERKVIYLGWMLQVPTDSERTQQGLLTQKSQQRYIPDKRVGEHKITRNFQYVWSDCGLPALQLHDHTQCNDWQHLLIFVEPSRQSIAGVCGRNLYAVRVSEAFSKERSSYTTELHTSVAGISVAFENHQPLWLIG